MAEMCGWSFELSSAEDWGRLLGSMQRHRYLVEVDLRIHWAVDEALAGLAAEVGMPSPAQSFPADLDRASRDPRAWRAATADEVALVLGVFWGPLRSRAALALRAALDRAELPKADHRPGAADADEPPHPELLLLDWVLLPVDELDTERHRGALRALEQAEEEVNPSEPIYVEGPILAEPELTAGPWDEPIFWASDPYAYVDYLFRGVAKAAKLAGPPVGLRDLE